MPPNLVMLIKKRLRTVGEFLPTAVNFRIGCKRDNFCAVLFCDRRLFVDNISAL